MTIFFLFGRGKYDAYTFGHIDTALELSLNDEIKYDVNDNVTSLNLNQAISIKILNDREYMPFTLLNMANSLSFALPKHLSPCT